MKQKLRDLVNPPEVSKELQLKDVAGLRPDGTQGMNKLGDTNRGHDGTLYKLVPRPGYGYNMWVPVKKAGGGNNMVAHHELKGKVLTESQRRVVRNIKKPVQVKEIPTKVKVSPKLKDKNKSVGVDMMKIPELLHNINHKQVFGVKQIMRQMSDHLKRKRMKFLS